jgi:hypothetical protein
MQVVLKFISECDYLVSFLFHFKNVVKIPRKILFNKYQKNKKNCFSKQHKALIQLDINTINAPNPQLNFQNTIKSEKKKKN